MDVETRRRLVEHFREQATKWIEQGPSLHGPFECVCGAEAAPNVFQPICPSCLKAIADELEKGGEQ